MSDVRQLYTRVRDAHPGVKVILLGHSLGSLIALTYGLRDSSGLTGMITSGTAIRDALNVPDWLRSASGLFSKVLPALTLGNGVKTEHLSHDPKVIAAYDADPLVHHVGSVRLDAEVGLVRAELLRRAPEWKLPLLMLHGGDDLICLVSGAQSFYDKTPHALVEYRQYVGLYHEIHNEIGKELVFKDVETWLTGRV